MPQSLFRVELAVPGINTWTKLVVKNMTWNYTKVSFMSRVLYVSGLSSHQDIPHRNKSQGKVVNALICAYELGSRGLCLDPWWNLWSAGRDSVISKDSEILVATLDCCYADRTPKFCLFYVPFRILACRCTIVTGFVVLWSSSRI
jgi:hypothetical protein